MLEQDDYEKALAAELLHLANTLKELRQAHSKVSGDAHECELGTGPRESWGDADTAYRAFSNRIIMVNDLEETFKDENLILGKMNTRTLSLATRQLRKMLLKAIECEEEQEALTGLDPSYFDNEPPGRFLSPVKIPPPVQALYNLEMELLTAVEREPESSLLYRLARNQYHITWKLTRFMISELFPTREDVLSASGSVRFEVVNNWHLRVVFE